MTSDREGVAIHYRAGLGAYVNKRSIRMAVVCILLSRFARRRLAKVGQTAGSGDARIPRKRRPSSWCNGKAVRVRANPSLPTCDDSYASVSDM